MCSVIGCKTVPGTALCFRLPEDPERRLAWVQFLAKTNVQTFRESSWTDMCICSNHFTGDCFENFDQIRMGVACRLLLKSTATPTIYFQSSQPEVSLPSVIKQEEVNITCVTSEDKTADVGCQCGALIEPCNRSTSFPEKPILLSKAVQVTTKSCSADVSSPFAMEETQAQQQHINKDDSIKEKFLLLETKGKHIVNEDCLLQLFRRHCPSCKSSCKLEKIVYGALIIMNQQCVKCEYKFQWKSQTQASLPTAKGQQQTRDTESTGQGHQEELHQSAPLEDGNNPSGVPAIVSEVIAFGDEEHNASDEDEDDGDDTKSSLNDDDYDPSAELTDFDGTSDTETEVPEDNTSGHDERQICARALCTECGRFFNTLKSHICKYKTNPYPCNVCGKRFKTESAVQIHCLVHKDTYLHPCKFCLKTFKTRVDKITHERTHPATNKPYECPDCQETFAKLHDRNTHRRDHRGVKNYTCRYCKIEFMSKYPLLRHERVHTGVKPFECELCQRSFSQLGSLKSHMRLHTGERPYKCPHCDKSFNHNISRKSHVQRYHSEVLPGSGHKQFGTNEKKDKSSVDDAEDRGCHKTVIDAGLSPELDEEDEEEQKERTSNKKTFRRRRATGRPKGRPSRKRLIASLCVDLAEQGGSLSPNMESDKSEMGHLRKTSFASVTREEEQNDAPSVTLEATEKGGKNLRKNTGRYRSKNHEVDEYDSGSDFDPGEQKKKKKTGRGKAGRMQGKLEDIRENN